MSKPKKLLIWTGEETMGDVEFREAFKRVLDIVKKIQENNADALSKIISTFGSLKDKLDSSTSSAITKADRIITTELESLLRRFSAEQKKIDDKLASVKDGVSPDVSEIISDIMSQIKLPEFILTAEDVRNKLELLKGGDRLSVQAIDGLDELIEGLNKKIKGSGQMGGLRPAPTGVETPQGTQDGANKDFTVTFKPQFITINGQSVYEDNGYSLAGSSGVLTITLDNAPASDEILRSHY